MVKITKEISDILRVTEQKNKRRYNIGIAREYEKMADTLETSTKSFISNITKCGETPTVIAQVSNKDDAFKCHQGYASALAVRLDPDSRQGVRELIDVRSGSNLPILVKDFIIDEVQLYQSRVFGADAVLMIPGLVDNKKMKDLIYKADILGLDCVVEVSSKEELEEMQEYNGRIVGINNRDLSKMSENDVDLSRTEELLPYVPKNTNVISLSGFNSFEDVQRISKTKITTRDGRERPLVSSIVVGRALEREDIREKVRELVGKKDIYNFFPKR